MTGTGGESGRRPSNPPQLVGNLTLWTTRAFASVVLPSYLLTDDFWNHPDCRHSDYYGSAYSAFLGQPYYHNEFSAVREALTPVSQNVTVLGDRTFQEVTKLKWGH